MVAKKKTTTIDKLFEITLYYRVPDTGAEDSTSLTVVASDDTEAREKALASGPKSRIGHPDRMAEAELQFAEIKFIARIDIP